MSTWRILAVSAAALIASLSPTNAGPCSKEIDQTQARLDARLEARAAGGPAGRESVAATDHRQPTPESIAAAEERLGDISPEKTQAAQAAMAQARAADAAGDRSACEQALADAQRLLGP